jgi:hypothetical protein
MQQRLFFNHTQPYSNYYLKPLDDAFTVFNFTKDDSACVVANITEDYRTIASIIDYGSLENIDNSFKAEDYLYFITDFFGLFESTIGIQDFEDISKENAMIRAFPNPFSDHINIQFKLSNRGVIELQVFNHHGQMVFSKRIHAGAEKNGFYQINWDGIYLNGSLIDPGVYYIRILSGNSFSSAKIIRL